MPTLTALALTPFAREWLAQTTSARVLNTFDYACNLINQHDAILALVTSERGLNPFAMLVTSNEPVPFGVVAADSVVSVAMDALTIGSMRVRIDSARLWNPLPDWEAVRQTFIVRPSLLAELSTTASALSDRRSLLDLYSPLAAQSPIEQALLARARRGALELVHGLRTGSLEPCLAGVKSLAGLGGGLTPAGDDFIVGVLLAVWAGLYNARAESLCRPIAEAAAPLTTTLSAAYLRAAARGECMAHWHMLFKAMRGPNPAPIRAALEALLVVGHSSGADALAGFVASAALTLTPYHS